MLNDDQSIPQVTEMFQCCQKLIIVPLMQSDAGLIQDIGNSHQTGTDLCGKADPLRLSAGKGSRCPCQSQVVQSHIHKEPGPRPDLF